MNILALAASNSRTSINRSLIDHATVRPHLSYPPKIGQ